MSHALRSLSSIALALAALALIAPSAHASGRDLWIECRDTGTIGANHSPQDYAEAILTAPGDGAEYSSCLAAIRAAQQQSALGGTGKPSGGKGKTSGGKGGPDANPAGGAEGRAGAAEGRVTPTELGDALAAKQVDPAAYPEATPPTAPPVELGGDRVQLGEVASPSIARTLSLPLPLAAAAFVVLLSGALPLARAFAARLGS